MCSYQIQILMRSVVDSASLVACQGDLKNTEALMKVAIHGKGYPHSEYCCQKGKGYKNSVSAFSQGEPQIDNFCRL